MNGEELKKKVRSGGIVYGTMLSMSRKPSLVRADIGIRSRLCGHRYGALSPRPG